MFSSCGNDDRGSNLNDNTEEAMQSNYDVKLLIGLSGAKGVLYYITVEDGIKYNVEYKDKESAVKEYVHQNFYEDDLKGEQPDLFDYFNFDYNSDYSLNLEQNKKINNYILGITEYEVIPPPPMPLTLAHMYPIPYKFGVELRVLNRETNELNKAGGEFDDIKDENIKELIKYLIEISPIPITDYDGKSPLENM